MKDLGLRRWGGYSSPTEVRRATVSELSRHGQLFGYRTMWLTLKQKHGLCVKRETVMRMLCELNPCGTLSRTRHRYVRRTYHSMGPNYLWHVDGYDKLKLFGMAIFGCLDGFSRRIMWLKCGPTNNNPEVTKNNFIDCIRRGSVIPMRLRTDCGTENVTMATIQCTLRHIFRQITSYVCPSCKYSLISSSSFSILSNWV